MSKEYDHFWKYHNKDNMDVHAVMLINSQQAENGKLKEFARSIIKDYCWDLGDPDGGTVQDLAEKLGLIEPCVATEADVDAEWDGYEVGDTIYRFASILKEKDNEREEA